MDDPASGDDARHQRSALLLDGGVAVDEGAVGCTLPLDGRYLLDSDRDSLKRARLCALAAIPRFGLPRGIESLVEERLAEGVHVRLRCASQFDDGLHHLNGGQVATVKSSQRFNC